ncbi:MAG: hypothetical protein K0S41_1961 [Anaerocolumna sp.]|jgi:hypothetical protein|nr:hypothetical protein [Anaerocolumna sp.]
MIGDKEEIDVRYMEISEFINGFSVRPDGSMAMLLGAGASISSGIMSGGQMVWDFKRSIYCVENKISTSSFKDLSKEATQTEIQSYFNSKGTYPVQNSPEEYPFYFEECYTDRRSRELYIQGKVKDVTPYSGYLCLGAIISEKRIDLVTTTNFDDLVQAGIYTLNPGLSIKKISSAIKESVGFNLHDGFPNIIKLHGDYLIDKLKNTSDELKEMEREIGDIFEHGIRDKGLVIVGYAGNDNSVMTILEKLVIQEKSLPYGIIWCKPINTKLSERAELFMENACSRNELSGVLEIESFDDLMYRLYLTLNKSYSEIDSSWKEVTKIRPVLFGNMNKHKGFVKSNTFESIMYPTKCYTFKTSIQKWRDLRECCSGHNIVAALHNGEVWAFGNEVNLCDIFKEKMISKITLMEIPDYMMMKDSSIIIGMYYDIIKTSMIRKGFYCFGKNKFYNINSIKYENGLKLYDAIEVFLSYLNKKINLTFLPTLYMEKLNGSDLKTIEKQNIINKYQSKLYNKPISEVFNEWTKNITTNKQLEFCLDGAKLVFNRLVYTYGGYGRKDEWPQIQCYQCVEPKMSFSVDDNNKKSINQLRGLINYGPIEKLKNGIEVDTIKLAVLTPKQNYQQIIHHLQKLKKQAIPTTEKDFLPEFMGFQQIFRKDIDIPTLDDNLRYMEYDGEKAKNNSPNKFFQGLSKYIDIFEKNKPDFDLLIIYIPSYFSHLRELKNDNVYFDLHDSLKLYCAERGIIMQIIEERSAVPTQYTDTAKVLWGLSTGIYSKTVGRLWRPENFNENTAFIGLSYVQSVREGEKVSIGCSQLFDSEGNGMRLYLRPIKNPQYIQQNPFMRSEDARRLMMSLKKLYDDSIPTYNLKRVVIHKTTFFTKEEIEGITKGLNGVDDIELLQIQEFTPWRCIRFDSEDMLKGLSYYPIQRGSVIPLDEYSFLLWTHGSVQDEDLAGTSKNYYKNSRGIPAPLLIRRFMGKASGETLVNEIMMLTKMNWNSGDSFYKVLPVTLDFAKTLSKMAKQDVVLYDKSYDFRYFM